MYDEFFSTAERLRREGVPFATATVVRAEKPTSGKPGDKAIIGLDGVMHGWIGGSCAQPTVVREALAALAQDRPRLIRLSPEPDALPPSPGVEDRPMTCFSGGTMEIFVEPQPPQPRLLILGSLPVSQSLAHLGRAMSYRVIAVDLDGDGTAMAHADQVETDLEGLCRHVHALTFVVVATHGQHDEEALEAALATDAPYVGLVASRKRAEAVRRELRTRGVPEEDLERIEAPAGLDIQAVRGDEIALSIMAEIVQRRRRVECVAWAGQEGEAGAEAATAVDPVCGMTVQVATAKASHQHEGVSYHFCCPGCAGRFAADPEAFLEAADRG